MVVPAAELKVMSEVDCEVVMRTPSALDKGEVPPLMVLPLPLSPKMTSEFVPVVEMLTPLACPKRALPPVKLPVSAAVTPESAPAVDMARPLALPIAAEPPWAVPPVIVRLIGDVMPPV